MLRSLSASRKILFAFMSITGLAAGAGAIVLWSLLDVTRSGDMIGRTLSPQIKAEMEVKFHAAQAYLLAEAVLAGDATADPAQVAAALDQARFYANAILDGAEYSGGIIAPTASDRVRRQMTSVLAALDDLQTALQQRLARAFDGRGTGPAEQDLDAEIKTAFTDFLDRADGAETIIRDTMMTALARQAAVKDRAMLAVACIGTLMAGLIFAFYRWLDVSLGRRIKAIADALDRMTGGDLDVVVPDWGTRDEVGLLREKLEALRHAFIRQKELENAVSIQHEAAEAGRKEAEKLQTEAEAQRRAAERERELAEKRARARDAFGAEFARVAELACAGDFKARIDIRTGEADLDRQVDALNDMLASIDAGIRSIMDVMAAVARGDLTRKMVGEYQGAFGEMQISVNTTLDELTRIAASLSDVSRVLTLEVVTLAQSSDRLSQRSTSQAASLEQTSAAIGSMSEKVRQTEADCAAAVVQVEDASNRARAGQDVVLDAISAVGKIDENARKVSDFIGVIDEISFQTNLLALNAGVEAARAGEAGKGFAVVAQEVRALAQRANEAASGIGRLIDESGRGVEEGVRLVTQTGEVLRDILGSITNIADVSGRIAESNRQQSLGIAEVSTVTADLDRLTQQNSVMADEGTTMSRNLQDRAQSMEMLIDFFTLKDMPRPANRRVSQ